MHFCFREQYLDLKRSCVLKPFDKADVLRAEIDTKKTFSLNQIPVRSLSVGSAATI